MANLEFKNLDELYNRIKPALYSKVEELKRKSIYYIKEEDIWNYFSSSSWRKSESLSLANMVSDILNLNDDDIKEYINHREDKNDKLTNTEFEEDSLLWKTKKI